jgi:PAS domain S-box-containing protein
VTGTASPIRALLRRLVPSTMGARLVLTAAVIAATTTVVTLGINTALVNAQTDARTRSDIAARFSGLRSFLALDAQGMVAATGHVRDTPAFRTSFETGGGPDLQSRYGNRLLAETGATAFVGLSTSGHVLISSGTSADVAHLTAIATRRGSAETTGFARIEGGLGLVYGTPVTASDGSRPVGYLIVARLADASRFDAILTHFTTDFREPGYRPPGIRLRSSAAGGPAVAFGATATEVVTVADLPAVDGGVAGTVLLRDLDPHEARAASVVIESSVLAGIAAALIGLGLGLWLAGIMRRPVGRMIRHVRRRAQLAARGVNEDDAQATPDFGLPLEFEELSSVIDDLVRHLDERRAELERAVRTAEYAEETLGIVVNESSEAKVVVQDDTIVIANPAAAEALGTTVGEIVGHNPGKILSEVEIRAEDGTGITGAELVEEALEERKTISVSLPNGSLRWYEVDVVRHTDAHHDRLLLTARDVTEERRIASIRAEIISLVGHDLRSPLTVVIGYLDLLQRPMTDEERARALDAARRNAARMADLLEDLLTATRAEELLAPSDLVPTSLVALAEEVVSSMGPTHSERPLLLEAECDPIVLGEEKRLRQVLVNLVTNAYKYSPDPEPIVVRVRCDEKNAHLEVIDHGPGIPADERDHVFARFARLRGGEGRTGVGLGLYIVSIIAHNHGGTVHIDETPGGGATFVVELPLVGTMIDGEFVL